MQRALATLDYPHANVTRVSCRGIGGRTRLGSASFRCLVSWKAPSGSTPSSGTAVVYAKPTRRGVCASTTTLNACTIVTRPKTGGTTGSAPLPGDPNYCSGATGSQCAYNYAAVAAADKAQAQTGKPVTAITCGASVYTPTLVVYRRAWNNAIASGLYVVTFKKGAKSWTMTVTSGP